MEKKFKTLIHFLSPFVLNSVSTSGNWNWSYTETTFNYFYTDAISIGSSDILVQVSKNDVCVPQTLLFQSLIQMDHKSTMLIFHQIHVTPADLMVSTEDPNNLWCSANGIHVAGVDQSGNRIKDIHLYHFSCGNLI